MTDFIFFNKIKKTGECRELINYETNPELRQEIIDLKPRLVLVVCWAGQNRSRIISEVLDSRGYASYHGGIEGAHPLIDEELENIQAIIFATENDKDRFYQRFPEQKQLGAPCRIIGLRDSPTARILDSGNKQVQKQKKKLACVWTN